MRSCNTRPLTALVRRFTLTACLLRIWLRRSSCFIFLNTSSTCTWHDIYTARRPSTGASVQRGDEQQQPHDKGGRCDGPPAFGLCVASAGGRAECRGIELRGHQSYRIAPPSSGTSVPLPLRTTSLPEPAQHIEGLSASVSWGRWLDVYGERRCLLTDAEIYSGDSIALSAQ